MTSCRSKVNEIIVIHQGKNKHHNSYHLLNTYYVLGTILCILDRLSHHICTMTFWGRYYCYHILPMKKLRHRAVKNLGQDHTASTRGSKDSNPGRRTPKPVFWMTRLRVYMYKVHKEDHNSICSDIGLHFKKIQPLLHIPIALLHCPSLSHTCPTWL